MKKCMNSGDSFVDESLEGIYKAYPSFYEKGCGDIRAVVHRGKEKGKVSIVTGGGYGHIPVFLGYVGDGLCDGAAVGNVFTSPSCEAILNATRAVDNGNGVLYLFGNYFGDGMNFEMAAEMAALEGIRTEIVRVSDDVASAPRKEYTQRRGIAGICLAYKVAGACAKSGASLEEVARIARKTVENTASYGVAFSSCTLPGADRPIFEINDQDMELGMGIHGEPGIKRVRMMSSRDLARELCPAVLKDLSVVEGEKVAVLVNGLGMTSREELFILYKDVAVYLEEKGIVIGKTMVGEFATSLEMAGLSLTIMRMDDEMESLMKEQEYTPFIRY